MVKLPPPTAAPEVMHWWNTEVEEPGDQDVLNKVKEQVGKEQVMRGL